MGVAGTYTATRQLKHLHGTLGSWRAVEAHLGAKINYATLRDYANGTPVRKKSHKIVLNLLPWRDMPPEEIEKAIVNRKNIQSP
jgi:hypothetical protein